MSQSIEKVLDAYKFDQYKLVLGDIGSVIFGA